MTIKWCGSEAELVLVSSHEKLPDLMTELFWTKLDSHIVVNLCQHCEGGGGQLKNTNNFAQVEVYQPTPLHQQTSALFSHQTL